MTQRKSEPKWAPEWKELKGLMNLIEEKHWSDEWLALLQAKPSTDLKNPYDDMWLSNKLAWFLTNGATGIIFLVDYVWGNEGLAIYFEFLKWFIQNDYKLGHFHPSKALMTAINAHQGVIKNTDVADLLTMLSEFSKNFQVKDGIDPKEAVGWKPQNKKS